MSNITLSAGVRQNLLSLQQTASLLNTTQNRLATGKKVNSAFDNPVAYFTSQSLSNRATDLSSLLDQIGQAVQTLNAANNGLTSLTSLLQQALSIVKQAQSSAEPGLGTDVGTLSGATTAGTAGNVVVAVTGGSTFTLAVAATDTAASIIANFNAIPGLGSNGAVTATTDSTGHLELQANPLFSYTVTADATTAAIGLTANAATNFVATSTANSARTTLTDNYNALLTQIDQLAGDASYNGVNLLTGNNLKVVFNETNTSSLTIAGVNFTSTGLGLAQASTSNGGAFQSDTSVQNTINSIDAALTTVRTQSETFGTNVATIQVRQDFTQNLVNTLQTGSDNLVVADQNLESANLLTLQTRQQLSISALSIANQAQQAVLKLFP